MKNLIKFIILLIVVIYSNNADACFDIFSTKKSKIEQTFADPKITVVGAGPWGTAIAAVIAKKGHRVIIRDKDAEPLEEINANHTNSRLGPITLPENIVGVHELDYAVKNSNIIFLVTPSDTIAKVTSDLAKMTLLMEREPIIVCMAKGFGYRKSDEEQKNPLRLLDVIAENLPKEFNRKNLVYVSGPSLAIEVAQGKYTSLKCACRNLQVANGVKGLLASNRVSVETTKDITGVQIGAAAKNPYAIMYGILKKSQKYIPEVGDNALATFESKVLDEMKRLIFMRFSSRAYPSTITSVAVVGDLGVTYESGRNGIFGRTSAQNYFARGMSFEASLAAVTKTTEGINATKALYAISKKYQLNLSIIECLYRILFENARLEDEIPNLFRELAVKRTIKNKGLSRDKIVVLFRDVTSILNGELGGK